MTSTAPEVRIRAAIFERRVAPWRAKLNKTFGEMLAKSFAMALRRRRKSKGWRRHVRATKAKTRRTTAIH